MSKLGLKLGRWVHIEFEVTSQYGANPSPPPAAINPIPHSPSVAGRGPMDCGSALSTKPVPPTPPNPSSANLPESPTPQRKIWIKPTAPASKKQQQQQQRRKKGSGWDEKRVVGFVDYDEGERRVSTEISGARKDEIPARYRLRVDGSRWQKDWKLSEVVDQVMRLRHWEDVDGVLNRWAGRFARKNFPLLIREITSTGSLDHAVHVFRWMKNQRHYSPRSDIYNMLISLHAKHNQTDQARGLFFEMQHWRCKPDTETYNALINAHGRVGQWRWAMNIMEDMLQAAVGCARCWFVFVLSSTSPTEEDTGEEVIAVMQRGEGSGDLIGRQRRWRRRVEIFLSSLADLDFNLHPVSNNNLSYMIPPSRTTYNNLISACGSGGHWKEALEICKKMTENGVGPDLVTHNIILSAFKRGAQYSKALAYFDLMKETNICPDTITFNIVIHCLVKLGQFGKAVDIFNSMREKGAKCQPDIVTFTCIIHAYSTCGQIENCKVVFDMILAEGLKPNIVAYNALIGAYASNGMHTEALATFNLLKHAGLRPDVVSYTSLLNAYGRSGQPEKAKGVFDMIKQNSLRPNIVSYNALIDAYGSSGLLAEAIGMLHAMEEDGVQADVVSISTLLAACGRCSQIVNIDSVLSAARSRRIKLNTVAYNSAIGSYMSVEEYDKAVSLYRSMREDNIKPDSITFNILISGSCKLKKYAESLQFLDEMMDLNIPFSKEVYSSLIHSYSKQGQLTEAECIFNMMKGTDCSPDVITYTSMIHAYSIAGNWMKAWELFEDMERNNIQPDPILCSSLMEALNTGCQPEKVLWLADLMREKSIPLNSSAYFGVIYACSMVRDWRAAIKTIECMETSFSSISLGLLNQLLHFLGKSGKIETMMKVYYKILSSHSNVSLVTHTILLKNLLTSGRWRMCIEVLQWMEDAGIQPTLNMYRSVLSYARKDNSMEHANLIQERISNLRGKID
ncbi:PPR repeat [Musa troglodytarum]|uniref:PPR repeat n=1 Tax=Musa troglodytarum TaxID=320322 RepID=A0A9E7GNM2_9LILI|nr:PPR repeat [Musa troglodytarum]